jgi:hypothetical protein
MQHCQDIPGRSFQRHWVSGPLGSFAVVTVRYYTTALIEDIELWLRVRIEAELKGTHGARWWDALPSAIQQRAAYRHKLACADFGTKRAGPAHSASWLSLGDAIRVLELLPTDSWVRCLEATSRSHRALGRTLRKVKSFRDIRIAHCQSEGPTPVEVSRALGSMAALCKLLRSEDYARTLAALSVLSTIHGDGRRLVFDLYEPYRKPRPHRRARLEAVAQLLGASMDPVRAEAEASYYDALISLCREACGTISGFFGEA